MDIHTLVIGGSGYIGSKLCQKLTNSTNLDIHWFGGAEPDIIMDYSLITPNFLKKYKNIILLAGHSSVAMCDHSILGSWKNNVTNFMNLLDCMDDQLLIYASSGSVYGDNESLCCTEECTLPLESKNYDFSKKAIELVAKRANKNTVGLRFGTVNGYSTNTRTDLMLNQMVLNAKTTSHIDVTCPNNYRSILGINDCVRAIEKIINVSPKGNHVYNVASLSGSIKSFGEAVVNNTNCNMAIHSDITSRFSFQLDVTKFCKDFDFKFEDTLDSIIEDLLESNYTENHRKDHVEY